MWEDKSARDRQETFATLTGEVEKTSTLLILTNLTQGGGEF